MTRVPRRHKSIVPSVLIWMSAMAGAVVVWFTLVWLALKFWAH